MGVVITGIVMCDGPHDNEDAQPHAAPSYQLTGTEIRDEDGVTIAYLSLTTMEWIMDGDSWSDLIIEGY